MIYIASDHRGFELKDVIKTHLSDEGKAYSDLGTKQNEEKVDYADFAFRVGGKIEEAPGDIGILICGSGVGMNVAVNKVKGVRASLCANEYFAKEAREHEDINVLVLASDVTDPEDAKKIVDTFLATEFDAIERRVRRLNKITEYESQ
jgi:ribose 5-phosphate isomerase B